jgi:hypothetical protein
MRFVVSFFVRLLRSNCLPCHDTPHQLCLSQEAELLAAREGRKGNNQLYYIDYSLLKPGVQSHSIRNQCCMSATAC